jgi:hypothetical protein
MKLTGHKTLAMFTRYNTVDSDDARLAMEMLCRFLEGAECSYNAPEGVDTKKQGHRVPIFISLWLPVVHDLQTPPPIISIGYNHSSSKILASIQEQ